MEIDYSKSIIDLIFGHADTTPDRTALVFDVGDGPIDQLTYAELAERIRGLSGALVARGLSGRHIGLLFAPGIEFVQALLACFAANSVAIPVAPIGRRQVRVRNIVELLAKGDAECLMLDDSMSGLFGAELLQALEPLGASCLEFAALQRRLDPMDPFSLAPDHLAVLQFTSGTISKPKGVMITHGNLIADETIIRKGFGHDRDSHFVGWVPHYHDQGLFGNILQPLFLGSTCVLTAPTAFVNRPMLWLDLISRYGAHTSGGPNFGFDLCTNYALRRGVPDLDLSSWRVAFNGAERVRPRTLRQFAEVFRDVGFDERAFLPCYGLAECTLVTVAMPYWTAPSIDSRDVAALSLGTSADAMNGHEGLEFVCCGPEMDGSEAIVVDPATNVRQPDGSVGEIWLRGPHIAAGYWKDPARTEETFAAYLSTGEGPYMRSGDLAFSGPDGLYIVGRIKDLIILRGRNYAPSDVEQVWSELSDTGGETRSAAIQIEIDEQQHVVLVAEVSRLEMRRMDETATQKMALALRAAAMDKLDLGVTDLVLVSEGAIPRTTSGKVQRKRVGEMLTQQALPIVGVAGPLSALLETRQKRPETLTP
jgi:acyl-CoA synthetase (AMP-forming)/AMP-acid ligase II